MKYSFAILASALGLALAAPAPESKAAVEARQIQTVYLTFYGADSDAKYDVAAPADGTPFTISKSCSQPGLVLHHSQPITSILSTHTFNSPWALPGIPCCCQLLTDPSTDHPEISVSKIYLAGGATCFVRGSEGSYTTVTIGEHPVGPPQPQVSGQCFRL